ncbi:MAG TPA: hypothetical protein VFE30_10950 [Anaeromyxobacteraceae bacterium]|nr:hypothetical protein [Anaeromyxobacteraceae bacterium]
MRAHLWLRSTTLDAALPDLGAPGKAELLAAVEGHVLASAELMGTYQKRR